MSTNLATILGSETLPAAMLESIQEAFDAKIAESEKRIRTEAEAEVREQFAAQYRHDKANIIEAMDRTLTEAVKRNARRSHKALTKVNESRTKLDESLSVSKQVFATRLRESVDVANKFVTDHLVKQIKSLNEEKAALAARQTQLEGAYKKLKKTMAEQQAARLQKVDEFVVRRLKQELEEFHQDHRALNETRAKLVRESKERIKSTQTKFVAESAKKVETMINANLKREIKEIHEDIERNRQDTFGRRIFEAIATEYMNSFYIEGTEVGKLTKMLEGKNAEIAQIRTKLVESNKAIDAANTKQRLAEDRASRTKIMSELLGSLRGDKRATMNQLLESTKTEGLRAAFDRYLPVVLSDGSRKPAAPAKSNTLVEGRAPARRTVEVSGDKPVRPDNTSRNSSENEFNADLGAIVRLAGLSK